MSLALRDGRFDLTMADCVLSRNSLAIANEEGFHQAGAALAAMDSCSQWWWGDYLLFAEKNNLKSVLDAAHADLHRSRIQCYVECARLFAPEDRNPALTFTHHEAVMYILGDQGTVTQAKRWLARAVAEKMTVGELREAMRIDKRKGENDPGPMRGVFRITDFIKVSRWSETVKVADLPKEEADEIRKTTEPLFNFLCELHRKSF